MKQYRIPALTLSLLGVANAIYLTIIKYANNPQLCIQGVGNCWSVNISRYSELFGIPVALLGAITFSFLTVAIWLENSKHSWSKLTIYFEFGVSLFGVMFSAYLTYIELFVINAVCPFCVLSAIIILLIWLRSLVLLLKKW
jgi:uncharacterized membrane protein